MRRWFRVALVVLALFVALALTGCDQEEPQAERQKPKDSASEQSEGATTLAQAPEPAGLGETAKVGPFAVTLNSATRRSADGGRHAMVDLTLENRSQQPADASDADYLLRDGEGYSFEAGSAPDQRPRPEGQVEPGGKASGQVGFDLGDEPADGRLELSVSLPDNPQAARFEFEAEEAKKEPEPKPEPEPEPEPEAAEKNEPPATSVRPGYSLVEDPSGSLSVEVPSSWSSETGADSEKQGGEGSYSYYAGEYLTSSITTARSLDAWYGNLPGSGQGSGAYLAASEALAQQYTDDELIYSLLHDDKAAECAEGPARDLDRAPYSGKVQAWFDCNGADNAYYVFAAAPEGRACVVAGVAKIVSGAEEADREAVEHLIDSFEVDCGALPPPTPLASSASASASAEATASGPSSASQSPSAEAETSSCGDFRTMSGEPSQWQAQQYYDFVATPEEKAILDPDGDGFACEDLEPGVGGTDAEGGGDASPEPDDSSPDPGTPAPEEPSTAPPDSSGPVNCDGVNGPIPTPPGDPNNLDGDGDGQACE